MLELPPAPTAEPATYVGARGLPAGDFFLPSGAAIARPLAYIAGLFERDFDLDLLASSSFLRRIS